MPSVDSIVVVGLGQMGTHYTKSLLSLGWIADNIIGVDINPEKIAVYQSKYPSIRVLNELPERVSVAIVTASTPSHHTVIQALAERGAKWIFSEKPLGIDMQAFSQIMDTVNHYGVQIYTAYLIGFSPVVEQLTSFMKDHNLIMVEGNGVWGKNRVGDKRPSAGNYADESVHAVHLLKRLAKINQSIWGSTTSVELSFDDFVDAEAQARAHAQDESFPLVVDSSTSANIFLESENVTVRIAVHSSFVRPQQVREVSVILAEKQYPAQPRYSVKLEFDVLLGGVRVDVITLVEISTGETLRSEIQSDKVLLELGAFLDVVKGQIDSRLTDVSESGEIMEYLDVADRTTGSGVRIENPHLR